MKDSTIFDNIDTKLKDRFKLFHYENPQIFKAFKEMCFTLSSMGRTRYSAECIINKIRWDHDSSTTGEVFKINKDYTALYSRLMVYHYPQFKDFFEFRAMKPCDRRMSSEECYRLSA